MARVITLFGSSGVVHLITVIGTCTDWFGLAYVVRVDVGHEYLPIVWSFNPTFDNPSGTACLLSQSSRDLCRSLPYGAVHRKPVKSGISREMTLDPSLAPRWALYHPPSHQAVVSDLQALRQASARTRVAKARDLYALQNLPFLLDVDDPQRRAELVVDAVRMALEQPILTSEQRIIAYTVLLPDAPTDQFSLAERRRLAADEIGRLLQDPGQRPAHRTVKTIEDRESRLIPRIADLLLDTEFSRAVLELHDLEPVVPPPVDPYDGKGYEWLESHATLRFSKTDPRVHTLRYSIVIRALRRGQRVFLMRHDSLSAGEEGPVRVLSKSEGHSFLGRTTDRAPSYSPQAHMLYFFLGRELSLGEETCIEYERSFEQVSPEHPYFSMEMDAAPQRLLVLEAHIPASMGCKEWVREVWASGAADAALVSSETFSIEGDAVARLRVKDAKPYHHYRLSWFT